MARANGARDGADGATLVLEAATIDGSVAVLRDGAVVSERTVAMRGEHEDRLMPAVVSALDEASVRVTDVRRVVCGAGPGSFTSLRIAASIAKGIAVATGARMYAVSSLALAAAECAETRHARRVAVVLDAMRGDVFVGAYEWHNGALTDLRVSPLQREEDARACAAELGATFVRAKPHARGAARLWSSILAPGPIDVATWEPEYGRKAEAQVRWEAAHGRPLTP